MQTILVVDDEPKIVQLARDYLEHAGFGVLTAGDGASALQAARVRQLDLVVLDLGLPGVDGLEVMRTIRAAGSTPVVSSPVRSCSMRCTASPSRPTSGRSMPTSRTSAASSSPSRRGRAISSPSTAWATASPRLRAADAATAAATVVAGGRALAATDVGARWLGRRLARPAVVGTRAARRRAPRLRLPHRSG